MNKKTFTVEIDGKKVELAVVKPSHRAMQQAQIVYNRAFREAVSPADGKPGALLRQNLDRVAREQNVWDDVKQAEYKRLVDAIVADEKIVTPGSGAKLSEARNAAVRLRRNRYELQLLLEKRNELDAVTAEAFADSARFNYLVSTCTVYADSGKPYYRDVEDYLSRENDPAAYPAGSAMGMIFHGLSEDFTKKLPENTFLRQYGFADEDGRLIRKDGKFVDGDGRLIDKDGNWVDEDGRPVDADGKPLPADVAEPLPFVDDDGNPVEPVNA